MIPLFKVFMAPDAAAAVSATLASGTVTQGPRVDAFEQTLRTHFSTDWVATTNSCTSAIHLALHLIKREYGLPDECQVLSSPLTCAATNFPVVANRLRIQWADIDPRTLNIDLADARRKLSSSTRILLFVHWGGTPVDYGALAKLAADYRAAHHRELVIIEDCAHAWESYYRGQLLGSNRGTFACFSFQAIKALTTGDGGLLIAPNETFCKQARLARWFGLDRDQRQDFRSGQDIRHAGFKFHMNDLNASLGQANYPHVRQNVARHKDNARFYYDALRNTPGVTLLDRDEAADSCYWLFTIRVENRNRFAQAMQAAGIQVNPVHTRNDAYTALEEFRSLLPGMDAVADDMICIPVGWWVTDDERQHIVDSIRRGW